MCLAILFNGWISYPLAERACLSTHRRSSDGPWQGPSGVPALSPDHAPDGCDDRPERHGRYVRGVHFEASPTFRGKRSLHFAKRADHARRNLYDNRHFPVGRD